MSVRVGMGALAALLMLGACGDDASEGPSLTQEDSWVAVLPGDYDCAVGVHFGDDARYEIRTVCALEGGGLGVQIERGRYTVDGDEVRYVPTASSCPGAPPKPETQWWAIDDGQLIISTSEGSITLDPYVDEYQAGHNGSGSAVGIYGCWVGSDFYKDPITAI